MKTTRFFTLFAALALTISAYAFDFKDGDLKTSLYYNITSSTAPYTVEVTYQAYKAGTKTYPFYLTEVVIPSTVSYGGITYSVTSIGRSAFYYCEDLTSVSIPNTVTSIGADAFLGCTGLTSVTIPSSVTSIGDRAFLGCSLLSSVASPSGVTSIGASAFSGCSQLYFTIPSSVTSIGARAFYGCSRLSSVTIPSGVTSIGASTFKNCSNLTTVTIPESVTFIDDGAFSNCNNLKSFKCKGNPEIVSAAYFLIDKSLLTNIVAPASVFDVEESKWSTCSKILVSVTITGGELTNKAFGLIYVSNTTLKTLDLTAASNSQLADNIFKGCSLLSNVSLPASLTDIGSSAFKDCIKLTSVTIPESVTKIGSEAFRSTKLTSVTIPSSVTSIGREAFRVIAQSPAVFSVVFNADSCADFYYYKDPTSGSVSKVFGALKSITIGNNVKRIPANFLRDVSLNSELTIPESVKSIGANALDTYKYFGTTLVVNCRSITPPTLATSLWAWLVRVPCDALETYKTATYWEKNIIYGSAFSGFKLTVNTNEYLGTAIQSPACDNIIVARSFRRGDRPEVDSVGRFVQWNDGITENPRTINLTSDTTFTAEFIALFKVKTQVNNANLGQVTGEGLYDENSQATITALPKTGYHFVAWNDQNTDNPRTVNVTTDSTFTATFAINTYSVSGSANDAKMGQVTGGKVYEYNTQATIVAVANEGYGFVQWNDGNTQNPRTFTVTSDSAFVATFDAKYTISVTSADAVMGTVVGSGKFMNNTQTTIEATPNDGYAFVQWNDGNTQNPRRFTVTSDSAFVATFELKSFNVTATTTQTAMGQVTGSGIYEYNTQATIEAIPNEGYTFVQWNDLNTENPRTILVTSDATYTATFMTITAIEQVTAETLNLRIENGTILCDGDMRIYDLIGRDVTHQNGLLQGVYMVRVDNLVVKVMVK